MLYTILYQHKDYLEITFLNAQLISVEIPSILLNLEIQHKKKIIKFSALCCMGSAFLLTNASVFLYKLKSLCLLGKIISEALLRRNILKQCSARVSL